MISKPKTSISLLLPFLILVLAALFRPSASNVDQDRTECENQLVGLATCLPYVGGDAKSPTMDCCTGLKPVIDKSRKCLCVLIKDRDDPTLGLKINLTLALGLPNACHTPVNITECIDLLHLSPNSTDAKIFEGSTTTGNTTTTATTASATNSTTTSPTVIPTTTADSNSHGGIKLMTSRGLVITCAAAFASFVSSTYMLF